MKYILITPNRESNILSLNEAYIKPIAEYGLTPVISGYFSDAANYIDDVIGILLSGGGDLGKNLLDEPIHSAAKNIDDERDLFEAKIIKSAFEKRIPILGICRGAQVLNSTFGGKLKQDTPNHVQNLPRHKASHDIYIKSGTKLYEIIGKNQIKVNSFHHQCILKAAPFFEISAISQDNITEAIECSLNNYFCMGIQWHPEAMTNEYSKRIFKAFLDNCAEYQAVNCRHF